MGRTQLSLIPLSRVTVENADHSYSQKLSDHQSILQGFLDTYRTRNLSPTTLASDSRFLKGWFEGILIPDESHSEGERQLFIWEAMAPLHGRKRIVEFSKGLCALELKVSTRLGYMGLLRRSFEYVHEWPFIPRSEESIIQKYGPIEQPVLTYDYPVHSVEVEIEGFALTGDDLLDFYDFIRTEYIARSQKKLTASRDYSMVVMAGESGLRRIELRGLDLFGTHRDIFYDREYFQTRCGKGTRGSGSRSRKTLFTELARLTTKAYEEQIRSHFTNATINPALYLAETGARISVGAMSENLKKIVMAAREAGLELPPNMGWHALRKSFATNYMEQYPERIWDLLKMMGHINPSTLYRYILPKSGNLNRTINCVFERLTRSPVF